MTFAAEPAADRERSLKTLLLGRDRHQRVRVSQSLTAIAVFLVLAMIQHGEVMLGLIDERESWLLTGFTLLGAIVFYALIRSGANLRLGVDPSLTLPQCVFACTSVAVSYGITGAARGSLMCLLILVLMFGMFALTPTQARRLAVYAVTLLSIVMFWKSRTDPLRYPAAVELVHFVFAVTVLTSVSVLAVRLGRLRERLSAQKRELRAALGRIEALANRDEVTGLHNRRFMLAQLEHEHARCARSGHPFCVALIDIDHFKRVNDEYGHAAGDDVLKALAATGLGQLRDADVLARWGGEEFLVLLPNTPVNLAVKGIERVREKVAASMFTTGTLLLQVTVSAGLAEYRSQESVSQLVERADRALYEAKAGGRNRVVTA